MLMDSMMAEVTEAVETAETTDTGGYSQITDDGTRMKRNNLLSLGLTPEGSTTQITADLRGYELEVVV
jgi:hypothetical protein